MADESEQKLIANKFELENKLLTRVSKSELLERRILMSESAPSLHLAQSALINKLAHRPNAEELRAKNILKGDKNISPALQDAQLNLSKHKLEEDLSKKIVARPTKETLIEQKILDVTDAAR